MSDTFTKIPNYLIENMSNMKTGVFAICVAVARKTIGYQKEWDKISVKQFEELTGLSNKSVVDLVSRAVEQGWIVRRQYGSQSFEYKLNESCKTSVETTQEYSESSVETSEETTLDSTETSVEITPEPVKKLHTQKKERNKSTNVDEQAPQNLQNGKLKNLSTSSGKKEKPRKPAKTDKQDDAEPTTQEHQEWFAAMCWLVYGHKDYTLLSETDKIAIGKTGKELRKSNYTLDDLRSWYRDIWSNEFPGKQKDSNGKNFVTRPMLKQIKTGIGRVRATESNRESGFLPARSGKTSYANLEQL